MHDKKTQDDRCKKLFDLGLKYNGVEFLYHDINFHWTDVTCMSDEEFEKAYQGAVKRKAVIDSQPEE